MSPTDDRAMPELIDPELRPFVTALAAAWASHPPLETVEPAEQRRIAEQVRAPWTVGGPVMATTLDQTVAGPEGAIPIRILRPSGARGLPVMVYLHGGGWTIFSTRTHDRVMREYAARAGIAVIGVEYSLAPEHRFPRPVEETVAVVDWIRRQGPSLDLDPTRIVLAGDSAGAHIALGTCLTLRERGIPQIQGMVLNYGAIDDDFERGSYRRYGQGGFTLEAAEVAGFWRQYLGDLPVTDPRARPLRADLTGLPPACLTITELDPLTDENVALASALASAGVDTTATIYPATMHSFLEAVSIAAVSDRAYRDTAAWLSRILGHQPVSDGSQPGKALDPDV